MSFVNADTGTNDGLDVLKPDAINTGTLDIIGKYHKDLEFLINGKNAIEHSLKEKNIDDAEINQKLIQLNKSIVRLQEMIEAFEAEHGRNDE